MLLSVLAGSEVPRFSRQERGRANFGLRPGRLTFLMDGRLVLLLLSVFPFTRPQAAALLRVCCCPSRGGGQGSLLLTTALPTPLRPWLIGGTYRPSDGGGLHRSWFRTIFSRRRHVAPSRFGVGTPHVHSRNGDSGSRQRFCERGGAWRTVPAQVPSPGVSLPGPFVHEPSPAPPVARGWLHTSVECHGVRAESSVQARTCTGRLRRVVILLSSPHPFFWWYT